ncbi:MAG: hypothetical protein Q9157_004582 [Trypethelium eluteriae]
MERYHNVTHQQQEPASKRKKSATATTFDSTPSLAFIKRRLPAPLPPTKRRKILTWLSELPHHDYWQQQQNDSVASETNPSAEKEEFEKPAEESVPDQISLAGADKERDQPGDTDGMQDAAFYPMSREDVRRELEQLIEQGKKKLDATHLQDVNSGGDGEGIDG